MDIDNEERSISPADEQRQGDVTENGEGGEGPEETRQEAQGSFPYSDQVECGEAVIWGEQITNTIRKLKSLTFFAVGSTPIPAPDPPTTTTGKEGGILEEKNKRRGKTGGQPSRRGGRPRKSFPRHYNGGPESSGGIEFGQRQQGMGLDENGFPEGGNPGDLVQEAFGLDDVANYECVTSEEMKTEVKMEDGEMGTAEIMEVDKQRKQRRVNGTGEKPNNTYTEIITRALEENPQGLTVSEIYDYISSRYSYYHPTDDRWKNSVRHNLSISPYFHKGEKAKHGAGHVWTIAEDCRDIRSNRLQRRGLIPKGTEEHVPPEVEGIDISKLKTESEIAVANILGKYTRACNGEEEVKRDPVQQEPIQCPPPQEVDYDHQLIHEGYEEEDSSKLFLTEVECGIELHYDGIMASFTNQPINQIYSLDPAENQNGACLVEEVGSELIGLEVVEPGMVLDISNYPFFESSAEEEVFFMEDDPSTAPDTLQEDSQGQEQQ